MEKMLKKMDTLLFNDKYLHLSCCRIINIIVKSGLKFLDESIRNCVKYIHSSGARLNQFKECVILLKMNKMSTIPIDVPSRWNFTCTMSFVACKFKKVFGRMTENHSLLNILRRLMVRRRKR